MAQDGPSDLFIYMCWFEYQFKCSNVLMINSNLLLLHLLYSLGLAFLVCILCGVVFPTTLMSLRQVHLQGLWIPALTGR